jgi:hypothetical protein
MRFFSFCRGVIPLFFALNDFMLDTYDSEGRQVGGYVWHVWHDNKTDDG